MSAFSSNWRSNRSRLSLAAKSQDQSGAGGEQEVYVVGSGGHAKVIISLLHLLQYRVVQLLDDDPTKWSQVVGGVHVIGPVRRLAQLPQRPTVIAVGKNAARRQLAEEFPASWLTLVHPCAFVDPSVQLGAGAVVMAGAVVQADVVIGDHVIVNTRASVDHDCVVEDYAHIAPGATLAGNVTVETGVLFGVGASSTPGVRVGAGTVVGAGASVVCDLPRDIIARGVPAKPTCVESPYARL